MGTMAVHQVPLPMRPLFLRYTLAFLLMGSMNSCRAEDVADDIARHLKATHLLKIAHYIQWPAPAFEDPATPITIGVIGAEPLVEELERISPAHEIDKRRVVVKRLTVNDKTAKVHILYIGRRSGAIQGWLTQAERKPLLSVCDATHQLAHTCAVKFLLNEDRLRFDISLPAAERSGIKITAPLLTVARQVDK